MCREFAQKEVVSRWVADETTDKKASEALFLQLHPNLFKSSLEMTIWLQSLAHCSPVRRKDLCFAFALNLESGGNGRKDIRTYFDLIEFDEGRLK